MVSIPFQEFKANDDGSFDGGVQKTEMGEAGRKPEKHFPHIQGELSLKETQRFGQLCLGKCVPCQQRRQHQGQTLLQYQLLTERIPCTPEPVVQVWRLPQTLEGFGECCVSCSKHHNPNRRAGNVTQLKRDKAATHRARVT